MRNVTYRKYMSLAICKLALVLLSLPALALDSSSVLLKNNWDQFHHELMLLQNPDGDFAGVKIFYLHYRFEDYLNESTYVFLSRAPETRSVGQLMAGSGALITAELQNNRPILEVRVVLAESFDLKEGGPLFIRYLTNYPDRPVYNQVRLLVKKDDQGRFALFSLDGRHIRSLQLHQRREYLRRVGVSHISATFSQN